MKKAKTDYKAIFELIPSGQFRKDFKKISNDLEKVTEAEQVFEVLADGAHFGIPEKMKPHKLLGNWKNHWECHITPDLLLIWKEMETEKIIYLERIGSHSELFKM